MQKLYFFDNNGKKVFYNEIHNDNPCKCFLVGAECHCDWSPLWVECPTCKELFIASGVNVGATVFKVENDPEETEYCSQECLFKAFGVQYFDWLTISQ